MASYFWLLDITSIDLYETIIFHDVYTHSGPKQPGNDIGVYYH